MTAKCKRHGHVTLPYSILFLISVLNLSYFSPTHPVVLHFLLPHLYHILKLPALSYVCSLSIVNIQLVQTDINPMFLGWLVRCLRTQSCFHKDRTSKAECHMQPWYDHKKKLADGTDERLNTCELEQNSSKIYLCTDSTYFSAVDNYRYKRRLLLSGPQEDNIQKRKPVTVDEHKLDQRQKQINIGKNTLAYGRYANAVRRYTVS